MLIIDHADALIENTAHGLGVINNLMNEADGKIIKVIALTVADLQGFGVTKSQVAPLVLKPYNVEDMEHILRSRLPKGYTDSHAITVSAVAIVYKKNADVRLAFTLYNYAIHLAEVERLEAEKKVNDERTNRFKAIIEQKTAAI